MDADVTNVTALTIAILGTLSILFVIFVLPIWVIAHYWTKSRRERAAMTPDMEHMLQDLWRSAREMDRRMQTLETILDAEAPGARHAARSARQTTSVGEVQ